LGKEGFNSKLVELGFQLYDEVFDYSFDNESDIFKRTEMFVNNVERLTTLDLEQIYQTILPKIIHNYNRAIEISKDHSYIPDIIKQCVQECDINDSVFGRYHRFLNA
jgi:S-adenosylmethionine/arginine decarboxylase-like enzyme